MTNLNTIQLNSNSGHHFKAVQFTSASKEQMLAINKYLGAQAFQEKYLNNIISGYNDGDKLIPLFYKNGDVSLIELKDWLFVKGGEVHAVCTITSLIDNATEVLRKEFRNAD